MKDSDNLEFKELSQDIDPANSDKAILTNAALQISIALGMLVAYLACRRKAPWVYFPNSRRSPEHPGYRYTGFLDWIMPIITLKDTTLLSIAGLDGFMFLQTVKLLYRVFFIMSITVTPLLCILYYRNSEDAGSFFLRISIMHVNSNYVLFTTVAIVYLSTLFVLYLIFIYYKRYVSLRQLFLASPSAVTSIAKLKKLTKELPENCTALEYVDIKTRTVLFERLPRRITNDRECLEYVRSLGIGEVVDAVVIYNTQRLQKLYELRDVLIQDMEKEIHRIFLMMGQEYPQHRGSFGTEAAESLAMAVEEHTHRSFTLEEKTKMCNDFISAAEVYLSRKNLKTRIRFNMNLFKENEEAIAREKARLNQEAERVDEGERSGTMSTLASSSDVRINVDQSLFLRSNLMQNVSFFPINQLIHPIKNKAFFSLDLPVGKPSAFVTFADTKTAAVVLQSKIGTRVFSCSVSQAPSPHDIIWKNITRNEVARYVARSISVLLIVLLNIAFLYIVTRVIAILKLEKHPDSYFFGLIRKNSYVRALYEGFLTPLIYNILLFFVPIFIAMLLNMEGIRSHSTFQTKMMRTFSYFLFFNALFSASFSNTIIDTLRNIYNKDKTYKDVVGEISTKTTDSAILFFNTIVQRLCAGTAMIFLKPGPFIFNFFITPMVSKTRRQSKEIEFAPPMDFGNVLPNTLLIFPMAFVYACISPCILVLGWLFYLSTYFAYKNELMFSCLVEFESGGAYWSVTAKFIIYTIIVFQLVTGIQLYTKEHRILALSLLPLAVMSCLFSFGLSGMFEESCYNYPLNEPEESYLDEFSSRAVAERAKLLAAWTELVSAEEEDKLPLGNGPDGKLEARKAFYRDPALASTASELILPNNFYATIDYLKKYDSEGVYGLR